MRPFLFTIGDIRVPSFFFMVMIGALAATFFSSWWAKREGSDQVALLDMGIIAIIASVIGARVFHDSRGKPDVLSGKTDSRILFLAGRVRFHRSVHVHHSGVARLFLEAQPFNVEVHGPRRDGSADHHLLRARGVPFCWMLLREADRFFISPLPSTTPHRFPRPSDMLESPFMRRKFIL